MIEGVGELVRRQENNYVHGTTQISKYVSFQMHDTLEQIDAYLNSKFIHGNTDSQGREKPFFNVSTAATNVWYRATDLDRRHIRIRATKASGWLNSLLATAHLRDWMRRENFGVYLNEWGRTLARYGSAVTKIVENSSGLHIKVVPWNTLIVDPVDFDAAPRIEILELTEAQLRKRVQTHGYDKEQVDALCDAVKARETLDKKRKDNKSEFIKLYEVHGELPKALLTEGEGDEDTYVQQMHVVSFVGIRKGRKTEWQDFTVYSGQEDEDPYFKDDLIPEDGRTLAIGAVEHLFEAQWMTNHSMQAIKNTLDVASKLIFQTADARFIGRNVLTDIQDGEIFVHQQGFPLTKIENSKPDIVSWQNYAIQWKTLGNEIVGVSEAMLGAQPKSGTAWRQTEALLTESYSLFELMTENKALALEEKLRLRIIPFIKKGLDTTDEVAATLEAHEIHQVDARYIKGAAIKKTNRQIVETVLRGEVPTPQMQDEMTLQNSNALQQSLSSQSGVRFFKPSELDDRTWKEQFKDLEWEVDIDITGESYDTAEALQTLNTALQLTVTPGFDQNPRAQAIVGRILELTGAMSPVEYNAIPSPIQPIAPEAPETETPARKEPQRNISQ